MVICMRNKEKEKEIGYNNHLLIVINLTQTDVITILFHRVVKGNLKSYSTQPETNFGVTVTHSFSAPFTYRYDDFTGAIPI